MFGRKSKKYQADISGNNLLGSILAENENRFNRIQNQQMNVNQAINDYRDAVYGLNGKTSAMIQESYEADQNVRNKGFGKWLSGIGKKQEKEIQAEPVSYYSDKTADYMKRLELMNQQLTERSNEAKYLGFER